MYTSTNTTDTTIYFQREGNEVVSDLQSELGMSINLFSSIEKLVHVFNFTPLSQRVVWELAEGNKSISIQPGRLPDGPRLRHRCLFAVNYVSY